MTTLQISVPNELLELLGSEADAREHFTRTAVLDLVKRQVISQGKGAELLGMSLWDFHELMTEYDVPMVDLGEADLREGRCHIKKALGGRHE